jgi:SAM-dependent methyltransferase
MPNESLQKGWNWDLVEDLDYWLRPDGFVMNLPFLLGKPPAKVLDLGCGLGRHTVYFAALGYEVIAYDITEEAVKRTKQLLEKEQLSAKVKQGQMTNIPESNESFDLVLAYNVIYHAYKKDVIQTISEIYRLLKPGGLFFGTILTKNPEKPFYDSSVIIDEQTIIKQEEPEKGVPHFFSYPKDILDFFADFEIKELYYKEWYPSPLSVERILERKGHGHYFISKKEFKLRKSFILLKKRLSFFW